MFQPTPLPESPPPPAATPPPVDEGGAPPPSLAALFSAEESRLLRYAMSHTGGDFAAAQDLVQEAFLRLHQHGYHRVENPRAWLATVMRRLASDRRKKRGELPLIDGHDPADDGVESAPRALERAEAVARLRLHLGDLPPRDRELINLKFNESLDYASIAERTGLSVSNVGFRLHHLIKKLATALAGDAA